MLGRKKKGSSHCDYVFGSSTKFQRRMNGFVKADVCRHVSVCLPVFCGISFALKPFRDYSLCSACILPQPAFYSQSVVCILHSVCILPLVRSLQSAVRSPQSKFYTDRMTCRARGNFAVVCLTFIAEMKSNKGTRYKQTNFRPDYILERIDIYLV